MKTHVQAPGPLGGEGSKLSHKLSLGSGEKPGEGGVLSVHGNLLCCVLSIQGATKDGWVKMLHIVQKGREEWPRQLCFVTALVHFLQTKGEGLGC